MKKILFTILSLFSINAFSQNNENLRGIYTTTENNIQQLIEIRQEENKVIISNIYGQDMRIVDDINLEINTIDNDKFELNSNNQTYERVFGTSSSFLQSKNTSSFPINKILEGSWEITETMHDLVTGEKLSFDNGNQEIIENYNLSEMSEEGSLRFTDSQGKFYQGTFDSGKSLIIREINNPNADVQSEYGKLDGSGSSLDSDVLGKMFFTDANNFEINLIVNDWSSENKISLLKLVGKKNELNLMGDLNSDASLDGSDQSLIKGLFGISSDSSSFELLADIDSNGLIDNRDLQSINEEDQPIQKISPYFTGLWFDPSHSGEGIDIQILDDKRAFISWFTYDLDKNQQWFFGEAKIENNQFILDDIKMVKSGTVFGPNFNTNEIEFDTWGEGWIYFDGCENGTLFYNGRDEYKNGSLSLNRLTKIPELFCESSGSVGVFNQFSGIWFNPDRSGEGVLVSQVSGNRAIITWYTYDVDKTPFWMIGDASIEGNNAVTDEMQTTIGTEFGENFDPQEVQRVRWGSVNFKLLSCDKASIEYSYSGGTDTIELTRLGKVAGIRCFEF